jgi:hypothetical protein
MHSSNEALKKHTYLKTIIYFPRYILFIARFAFDPAEAQLQGEKASQTLERSATKRM